MKPGKLERNHAQRQLKAERARKREQDKLNRLVEKYAGVSAAALDTRREEANEKADFFLTVFEVAVIALAVSVAAELFSHFYLPLPSWTATALNAFTGTSALLAAIGWILGCRLANEARRINDVITKGPKRPTCKPAEALNGARAGRTPSGERVTVLFDEPFPKYEPIWDYDTPEEYLEAKAKGETAELEESEGR